MKNLWLFLSFLSTTSLYGQTKLPIIKATSKNVAINDGGFLDKNAWSLSPEAKPDVFTADRTRQTKWVTFYTNIDSIRVKVKPGTVFDFIILLNGKDSCYTRIASAIPLKKNVGKPQHDTISFTLTAYNAIHVKAIINNRDTVNVHLDIGSFDFRLTRDAVLKKTQLLAHQPDVMTGKAKPNYNDLEKVQTIQMGSLVFKNPTLLTTGLTAHDMDGRFGWNLFEDKCVEIDYDNNRLIIHSKLPKITVQKTPYGEGYAKSSLAFIRSFVCMKGTISIANKQYDGNYLLDTGSDKAMILDSIWQRKHNFPTDLTLLRTSTFSDPRGVKYENKVVVCPQLSLNSFPVANIPTTLLGSKNPVGFEMNYLGNDVLKRFNTIFDFHNDCIYLKPNKLAGLPFKEG